jgi:AcrR family transcriptional regulator
MKSTSKLSGEQRRAVILKAVRKVFVEKGFHGTTTRELAKAAGVSEALLFKHFPSKKALYSAIQLSCFNDQKPMIIERLKTLKPSAASLVFLVHFMISHMLDGRSPNDNERSFVRLVLRSLMDEGEFVRLAIQKGPSLWVKQVKACIKAAAASGHMVDRPVQPELSGWFVNQMTVMIMIHLMPTKPIIDFGVSRKKLIEQAVWFSLRGMGMKDKSIILYYNTKTIKNCLNTLKTPVSAR